MCGVRLSAAFQVSPSAPAAALRLLIESDDPVEHVECRFVESLTQRRGPDRQPVEGFADVAIGLGGDHPGGLVHRDAEWLIG